MVFHVQTESEQVYGAEAADTAWHALLHTHNPKDEPDASLTRRRAWCYPLSGKEASGPRLLAVTVWDHEVA